MTAEHQTIDLTAAPRAVLSASVRLLYRVLGEQRLGTARGNAWAAVCADRERAQARADVQRLLASARGTRQSRGPARRTDPAGVTGRRTR
jgi:hypothetical protein